MKTMTMVFLLGAACAVAEIAGPDGARLAGWPARLEVDGGVITPVSRATAEAAGYHEPTPEELAAWAAEDAAAAALVGPQPETLVPMLDADGNPVGTARILVDTNLQIIAVVNSASPQKTWAEQKAAYEARAAARLERISAAKEKNAAANSVPQLRAAVADILAAMEE